MESFMNMALKEAELACFEGNVPVGAIIVKDNMILVSAHNTKNTSKIAVNHAEILCIIEACKRLNSWYLNDCEMYVTLKPCDMCMAAIAEARIKKVYYLIDSNYGTNLSKNRDNIVLNKVNYSDNGYMNMLSDFFKDKRN